MAGLRPARPARGSRQLGAARRRFPGKTLPGTPRRLAGPVHALFAAAWAGPAWAHAVPASFDTDTIPWVLSLLLFSAAWLAYGVGAMRRRPTAGRRLAFHGGMLITGLALFGPFDDWAERSTAMHMVQHMLLMVVVAPLLVVARPLPQWRSVVGRRLDGGFRAVLRLTQYPVACALLHAVAIWGWHAPVTYLAALANPWWHALEHACFLFTAWLFWWSVMRASSRDGLKAGSALLFTLMHTGLLGALLVFAGEPLYRSESTSLEDQQLAGLVMWVPGGGAYLVAAAWAAWRWLARMEAGSDAARGTGLAAQRR